jgi:hypothetical protein
MMAFQDGPARVVFSALSWTLAIWPQGDSWLVENGLTQESDLPQSNGLIQTQWFQSHKKADPPQAPSCTRFVNDTLAKVNHMATSP